MTHKEIYQALIDGKTIIDHSRCGSKYILNKYGRVTFISEDGTHFNTTQGFHYPDDCEIYEEPKYQALYSIIVDGKLEYKVSPKDFMYGSKEQFDTHSYYLLELDRKFIKLLKREELK